MKLRGAFNKKAGTDVTPSLSARGRAAPGLEITPILKSGKGIAALQNGANLIGTFENTFYLFATVPRPAMLQGFNVFPGLKPRATFLPDRERTGA